MAGRRHSRRVGLVEVIVAGEHKRMTNDEE
jgi:hypothetical protein